MSDILLNDDKDIDITEGDLRLTSDPTLGGLVKVKQRLSQRFQFFLAEWFLDRTRGIPYYEQVFVKNPNPGVIDAVFKNEILSEPNIRELRSFSLDLEPDTRVLTVAFSGLADEGAFDFREEFSL